MKSTKLRWSVIIVAVAVIFILLYFVRWDDYTTLIAGQILIGFSIILVTFVNHYFLFPRFSRKSRLPLMILVLLAGAFITAIINAIFANWYGTSALTEGFLSFMVGHSMIHLFITFVYIAEQYIRGEQQKAELIAEKNRAELDMLKYQVNPHFLFNTLNNVYSLAIKENSILTAESILKLSGLMRFMLYESEKQKVPLPRELAYLEDFISLQKMRVSEEYNMDLSMEVRGEDYSGEQIAPMLLIPFVENAFKHGISTQHKPFIDIKLLINQGVLNLMVSNTIRPGSNQQLADKKNSGVGLENVKKRLDLLYPGRYRMDISHQEKIYTVNLEIQLR